MINKNQVDLQVAKPRPKWQVDSANLLVLQVKVATWHFARTNERGPEQKQLIAKKIGVKLMSLLRMIPG